MDGRWLSPLRTEHPLPTYGISDPTLWEHPSAIMGPTWMDNYFVDNSVFQRPDDLRSGRCSASAGQRPEHRGRSPRICLLGKQFAIREAMNIEFRHRGAKCVQSSGVRHSEHCGG